MQGIPAIFHRLYLIIQMLAINEDLFCSAEFVLLSLTEDKLQETSALMFIQVGIPQSFAYKMKMLPSYLFLFCFLCVMYKMFSYFWCLWSV